MLKFVLTTASATLLMVAGVSAQAAQNDLICHIDNQESYRLNVENQTLTHTLRSQDTLEIPLHEFSSGACIGCYKFAGVIQSDVYEGTIRAVVGPIAPIYLMQISINGVRSPEAKCN